MSKNTYYIDPQLGSDENDGLLPSSPLKTHCACTFHEGDTILFKRGSIIRDKLNTCTGSERGIITYGAYGTGNKPIFLGSISASEPDYWIEVSPSVWQYKKTFPSEVCNVIFNDGASCGNLRWQLEDLKIQGEWFYSGIGSSSNYEQNGIKHTVENDHLYLYSSTNPGTYYTSIECALWGSRKLVGGQQYIRFENLIFQNAGVHGFQESHAHHISINECEFAFIGGAVWSKERRIRFGNAVELWDGANNITLENCIFKNIYDAGITHQGGKQSTSPRQLYFKNNLFINCGLAAYECRGPAADEVYFEHNTCVNDGKGFSLQGEKPPRKSEIYPQPAGHHVFIWRIELNTQIGHVYIRNNIFAQAPYGAVIYSIIDPQDESKFIIDHNLYLYNAAPLLARMNGKNYLPSQFNLYQEETGQDKNSTYTDFEITDKTDYKIN